MSQLSTTDQTNGLLNAFKPRTSLTCQEKIVVQKLKRIYRPFVCNNFDSPNGTEDDDFVNIKISYC